MKGVFCVINCVTVRFRKANHKVYAIYEADL